MEITKDNIADVLKNEEFKKDILPAITTSEAVKTMIENNAKVQYQSKIDEEVSTIHSKYDDDMFTILGVRPGTGDDGKKIKTYEAIKTLYTELKGLRDQKESLTKDAKVIELNAKIKKLTEEGGGKHIQEIFDASKLTWDKEKEGFEKTITDLQGTTIDFQKKTEISNAVRGIKFNPDTPESIKKMVLENVEQKLMAGSKIQDNKIVFIDTDGKPIIDPVSHSPKTAEQMLATMDAIKDISLKDDNKKGGGADSTIKGSIQTTTVEGKDTKKLILPEGSVTTQTQFIEVAEKALIDSGLTRRDTEWDELKNKAFKELKVAEMPIE